MAQILERGQSRCVEPGVAPGRCVKYSAWHTPPRAIVVCVRTVWRHAHVHGVEVSRHYTTVGCLSWKMFVDICSFSKIYARRFERRARIPYRSES